MDDRELRRLFVLANAFKEGDLLVGGTRDDGERGDARRALLGLSVGDIRRTTLVDDGVTEALTRALNADVLPEVDCLTVGELRAALPDVAM